jgi:hypothetical protein
MPLASAHHAARTQALACQATAIPSHLRSLHDATPWRDACMAVTAAPDRWRSRNGQSAQNSPACPLSHRQGRV